MFAALSPPLSPLVLPPASDGAGTAHTLSWLVALCRELPSALCPPEHIPAPGWHLGQGHSWECPTGTVQQQGPLHGPHHPSPSAPGTPCPLPAPWGDAIAIRVCTLHFWILSPAQVCSEHRFPLVRATGTRNPVSTQMMGFILL